MATAAASKSKPSMFDSAKPMQDRFAPSNVRAILENWFDRHTNESFPWLPPKPDRVEMPFAIPLNPGLCVCYHKRSSHKAIRTKTGKTVRRDCSECGYCDRYQELVVGGQMDLLVHPRQKPTHLAPVDHKTTFRVDDRWRGQWETDTQPSTYLWAASELLGEKVREMYLNVIPLPLLNSSDRKCPQHQVSYLECNTEHLEFHILGPIERTSEQISQWKIDAMAAAWKYWAALKRVPEPPASRQAMRLLGMEGAFEAWAMCGNCDFREWCAAGRPPLAKGGFGFEVRRWEPWLKALPEGKPRRSAFYVDNSLLGDSLCTTKIVAGSGWGLASPARSTPLDVGSAVHAALEVWFRGKDSATALKRFDELWSDDAN